MARSAETYRGAKRNYVREKGALDLWRRRGVDAKRSVLHAREMAAEKNSALPVTIPEIDPAGMARALGGTDRGSALAIGPLPGNVEFRTLGDIQEWLGTAARAKAPDEKA